MELTETVRKIFLAGVGAVAETTEAAKDLIEKLIEKGELTVEQGKVLNEELKHKSFSKVEERLSELEKQVSELREKFGQSEHEEKNAGNE